MPTASEFAQARSPTGLESLILDDLLIWMRDHPDVLVVTDIKPENLAGRQQLARNAPDLAARFIPQIHGPEEFVPARSLGFDRLIFTVYRSELSVNQILEF